MSPSHHHSPVAICFCIAELNLSEMRSLHIFEGGRKLSCEFSALQLNYYLELKGVYSEKIRG